MRFKQSKGGIRTAFAFENSELTYTTSDRSGEKQQLIPYEALKVRDVSSIGVNRLMAQVAPELVCILAAAALMLVALCPPFAGAGPGFAIAFVALGCGLVEIRRRGVRLTVLQTEKGPVRIIQDEDHDAILNEIRARWIARLKELYGAIDFANDPVRELQKFQWLRANAVISEQELQHAVSRLRVSAIHARADVPDEAKLH